MSLIVALYAIKVCYKLAAFHRNSQRSTRSFQVKMQVIPATPTAGTGPRSLPLSSMVFSCWHSASLLRWRLWNASSVPLVCFILSFSKSLPLNSRRDFEPQTGSHSRIFRPGI